MTDACAIAIGAVSALGVGATAYRTAVVGAPARGAIVRDEQLEAAGLARPFAARAPADLGPSLGDRAAELLVMALAQAAAELDQVRSTWQTERVGLALGTSSGGMRT